jgi:hypothetical protein
MVTLRNWYLLVSKPWSVLRSCKDPHGFLTDPRIPVCANGKATGSHLDMHWTWNSASTDPESAKKKWEMWTLGWFFLGWMWHVDFLGLNFGLTDVKTWWTLEIKGARRVEIWSKTRFHVGEDDGLTGIHIDWTLVEWRVQKRPRPRQKKLVRAYWYTGYI